MEDKSENSINLPNYFAAIGLPKYFDPKPSIETLYVIANKHVSNIFYQNLGFHRKDLKYTELSLKNLEEELVSKQNGGNCFQQTELLYHALDKIGFNAYRIFANMLDGSPHDPNSTKPPLHFFIVVKIDGKIFMVDCGFSYNSLRYPLEIIPEQTQEIEINPLEKYKIEFNQTYYILYLMMKGEWIPLISFSNPLAPVTHDEVEQRYKYLIETKEDIVIRDYLIKLGKLTEDGRVGIKWLTKNKGFDSCLLTQVNGEMVKKVHENYEQFAEDAKRYFNFDVPPKNELRYFD